MVNIKMMKKLFPLKTGNLLCPWLKQQNAPGPKFSICYRSFQRPNHCVKSDYTTEQKGSLYDENYRLYLKNSRGDVISPFHDIPLHTKEGGIYNMIVEVPRWSNAKMEISTTEKLNPIKQDVKNGQLRFVANCFPHNGYLWNYGALPQTWEDPSHLNALTQTKGDSDPIDICEIGSMIHSTGSVIQVKLLGILALIDEGETDWKIIGIDVNDPISNELDNIEDVEKKMPGLLKATVKWYRYYKTPFGSPPNDFAFGGKIQDREFTHRIVEEVNLQWKALMEDNSGSNLHIEKSCTTYDCLHKISPYEAMYALQQKQAKGNTKICHSDVNRWHYIPGLIDM